MKFVSRVCSKCGAEIFADAAEGLCTACLLETGLGLFSDAVDRVNDPGRADRPRRIDTPAANGSIAAAFETEMPGSLGDYELLEEIGRGGQGGSLSRPTEKSQPRRRTKGCQDWPARLHQRASSDSGWKPKLQRVWIIQISFPFMKWASMEGHAISA